MTPSEQVMLTDQNTVEENKGSPRVSARLQVRSTSILKGWIRENVFHCYYGMHIIWYCDGKEEKKEQRNERIKEASKKELMERKWLMKTVLGRNESDGIVYRNQLALWTIPRERKRRTLQESWSGIKSPRSCTYQYGCPCLWSVLFLLISNCFHTLPSRLQRTAVRDAGPVTVLNAMLLGYPCPLFCKMNMSSDMVSNIAIK